MYASKCWKSAGGRVEGVVVIQAGGGAADVEAGWGAADVEGASTGLALGLLAPLIITVGSFGFQQFFLM